MILFEENVPAITNNISEYWPFRSYDTKFEVIWNSIDEAMPYLVPKLAIFLVRKQPFSAAFSAISRKPLGISIWGENDYPNKRLS